MNSCGCCECSRGLGCAIVSVNLKSNDSLVLEKIYCSKIDYQFDRTVQDSVQFIFEFYKSDTLVTVSKKDSIYQYEETCVSGDHSAYETDGYTCCRPM